MQYETEQSRTVQFWTDGTVSLDEVELSPPLKTALNTSMGIHCLFEMQQKVLVHLLNASSKRLVGDIILRAPTGSGKTLAYALPIVQCLVSRVVPRLRAIVVVPTRDLALQVSRVFRMLAGAVGISVAVTSGAESIANETGIFSKAEILVTTPGRLVDHVENSDGMILKDVRYLVLDESDRLLQDSHQGWIQSVIPVMGSHEGAERDGRPATKAAQRPECGILALAIQPDITARSFTRSSEASKESVRKILVSATQTRNPKRLVHLGLRRPTFFEPMPELENADERNVSSGFSVPSTLVEEAWVASQVQDKPMALLKMLGWSEGLYPSDESNQKKIPKLPRGDVKLIFTKSVEASHRLCRLLELCAYRLGKVGTVLQMSGELSPKRRAEVLDTIRKPVAISENSISKEDAPFTLVVCSDVLARGMDMFNVDTVINYDVPIHIRTYLHRAGRTARAGRKGVVSTLLLSKQAHHFRRMVYQAERGNQKVRVNNMSLFRDERNFLFSVVADALALLRRVVARENLGLIAVSDKLPSHTLYELWLLSKEAISEGEDPKSDDEDRDDVRRELEIEEPASKKRKSRPEDQAWTPTELTADEELEMDPDITHGGDTFHDLLYAQIARNVLSTGQ